MQVPERPARDMCGSEAHRTAPQSSWLSRPMCRPPKNHLYTLQPGQGVREATQTMMCQFSDNVDAHSLGRVSVWLWFQIIERTAWHTGNRHTFKQYKIKVNGVWIGRLPKCEKKSSKNKLFLSTFFVAQIYKQIPYRFEVIVRTACYCCSS